jgi:hypothetical protein
MAQDLPRSGPERRRRVCMVTASVETAARVVLEGGTGWGQGVLAGRIWACVERWGRGAIQARRLKAES